ncbi:hypothetical protein ACRALDRAFT_1060649 [Sodiomyces alcalophilus JCM 7366]|uniref:uncharacterized protein n=1 Tax=Sodiomyces alcalophilus JCM 7366 TaxID=591952 RepID=UPI0039B54BE4
MRSPQSRPSPIRAVFVLFAIAALFTYWSRAASNADDIASPSPPPAAEAMSGDVLSHLDVRIRQTATRPPTLVLDVTNNNPDTPLTILTWESPLDPGALPLGLFSITPEGASQPLDIPTIQIRRVMPPPRDSFATLKPGETRTQEHILRDSIVSPEQLGPKPEVVVKGTWMGVWTVPIEELTPDRLENMYTDEGRLTGPFETEPFKVTIHKA